MKLTAKRTIDPKHLKRAAKVEPELIGPYMEQIALELSKALDYWRIYDGPAEDVDTAIDALLALWAEVGARGMR